MKRAKNLIFLWLLMGAFSLFLSCTSTEAFNCPYLISNPRVELGEFEDQHNYAGMHFSLYNKSSQTIKSFTLSCMLYDEDGNNPFVGSNCIVSKCRWDLESGKSIDFVINLDPYISRVPDEAFIVDYIYLREINYADGSSWKDPYGMYCIREREE